MGDKDGSGKEAVFQQIFEESEETSYTDIQGKTDLVRGNSKCKCPEADSMVRLKNSRETKTTVDG